MRPKIRISEGSDAEQREQKISESQFRLSKRSNDVDAGPPPPPSACRRGPAFLLNKVRGEGAGPKGPPPSPLTLLRRKAGVFLFCGGFAAVLWLVFS